MIAGVTSPDPALSANPPEAAAGVMAVLRLAAALALGSAVSLGLARFSYALLLPPMRADLGWSYLLAGTMNTINAAGYLVGALAMPRLLARFEPRSLLLAGSVGAAVALALHGLVNGDAVLLALRFVAGLASAATFVAGGLMAAQLTQGPASVQPGLVLGIYYGGTGLGIVVSALLVPWFVAHGAVHAWQGAWLALAAAAALATGLMARETRRRHGRAPVPAGRAAFRWRSLGWGLAGYLMFGLGYIGYMTFVVTLLREQGLPGALITGFYVLLGLGVVASSWLWAGLLQRHRGGRPMALLNALLAAATLLPVLSAHPVAVFVSGALFGGVFLSVVASTTALVRHNLPAAAWPAGIAAFTIVFAAGQIVGPSLVGWVADGAGGLARGFAVSAAVLAAGALFASRQRAL
ncbi:MAG TPA: YbfB/YjiJ family MFS transporter [Methylibium sp.]|uniref:YbfB/YjiJ family MFS transporter n=1 Tax=Methylibium sp. TaxID=2067992 RepID=UPI002DBFC7AD|nr:YbfB/YjiJ family MFS transporter [Methylibium sp.]HEU4457888.1 YbfB/YjiJ family MFS transporter [Methylibium sp.]